jgi:hypothetical protein
VPHIAQIIYNQNTHNKYKYCFANIIIIID